jgi:hypothetical protein
MKKVGVKCSLKIWQKPSSNFSKIRRIFASVILTQAMVSRERESSVAVVATKHLALAYQPKRFISSVKYFHKVCQKISYKHRIEVYITQTVNNLVLSSPKLSSLNLSTPQLLPGIMSLLNDLISILGIQPLLIESKAI